jgi:hypothetical protein
MDVAVVFWLVIGAIAVAGVIGSSYRATKKNALIERLIEKGQPVPPELFNNPYNWRGFMIGGVVLTSVGVGLAIFFTALITWQVQGEGQRFLPFISAFPITLGVALLLIARYLKNNE